MRLEHFKVNIVQFFTKQIYIIYIAYFVKMVVLYLSLNYTMSIISQLLQKKFNFEQGQVSF